MLNIVQLWIERAQGLPIHLHLRGSPRAHRAGEGWSGPANYIAPFTSVPDPYKNIISSLTFSNTCEVELAKALSLLLARCDAPSTLKTLVIPGIGQSRTDPNFDWPNNLLQALTHMKLSDLTEATSPTLEQITSVLSNSPSLQTLRLRDVLAHSDEDIGISPT
jgi:hypothetical protein